MDYKIIYSSRRTVGLTVRDAQLIVRAPRGTSKKRIDEVVKRHLRWVTEKIKKQQEMQAAAPVLTEDDIEALKREAKLYFATKLDEYSRIMGLKPSRMKITSAQKRFGSCGKNGNICFSYRLMLYPEAAREYVVVHELAHLKHFDHSPAFYALVERYLPDYKSRARLLKGRSSN